MPSLTVSIYHNSLKGTRLRNQKQNAHWHRIQTRENDDSLNFISLWNPAVDGNCVCRHHLLHGYLWENDAVYNVSIYLNVLWTANLLNVSTFFLCTDRLSFHYFCLLTLQTVSYIQVTPSTFLSLCANSVSRLCCRYFSYHWCKTGNASCRLTQISKRQHNPCI